MTETGCQQFLGKYRGTVVNNLDPLQQKRIQAMVPDVSSVIPTSWATPCFPVGGPQMGIVSVPPIGSGVWIEFEQGDPDYPLWTGSWYGSPAEVPVSSQLTPAVVPQMTMQTPLQSTVHVSDAPGPVGGVLLRAGTSMISISTAGITITNGAAVITMIGPTVTINGVALAVAGP
jgi:hypothetical protein